MSSLADLQALAQQHDQPRLWYDLAAALFAAGEFAPALDAANRALAHAPDALPVYHLKAQACLRLDDPAAAAHTVEEGLARVPEHPDLLYLGALALKALGMVDEAAKLAGALASKFPDNPDFVMLAAWQATYSQLGDPRAIRAALETCSRLVAPAPPPHRFANTPAPDRQLRIGFLCQDIRRDSPIARFVAAPLLHLDRWQFDVRGYLTEATLAHMSDRLRAAIDGRGWVDVSSLDDDALVRRIRADEIDILVETAGNTAGNRQAALALRAAPVQVTCIGDPRTTGNPAIDARVVDDITDPESDPAAASYCTERLVRLPGCFLCYEPHEEAPPPRSPIGDGPITFGSFNVTDKTGPQCVDVWAGILRNVPHARLVLKSLSYRPAAVRERFLSIFEERGVESGRVQIIAERSTMAEHLAAYGGIDIALDTFPYNGTTTTCDAMWAGVPVITLRGSWHVARVGASLLSAVGATDLIAETPEAYVQLACDLARNRSRLAELHRTLRERMARSVLTDAAGYAQRLGAAYRTLWRAWCAATTSLRDSQ